MLHAVMKIFFGDYEIHSCILKIA